MVRNIFITNDNKDNISIYEKEPVYVVNFEKRDFDKVNRLSETKQSGIYILIGENQRYVGQASVGKRAEGVKTRLIEHEKSKEWWTSCIFFGRNDGLIDKSQLDYLEDYYIERFTEAGFDMANSKKGNTSAIQKLNKIKADEIRDIFEEILDDVANIELFEKKEILDEALSEEQLFVKFDGKVFRSQSPRHVEIQFVQALLKDKKYRKLLHEHIVDEKASFKNNLGRKQNILPSGQVAAKELEPDIFLWVNQSKIQTSVAIKKIAAWLDLAIEINF